VIRSDRQDTNVNEQTVSTTVSIESPHADRSCILDDPMIWFFDRNGEKLRYEITRDRKDGRYRVVITRPDGSESVEEVDEPTELIERSVQFMNSLRGDGWRVA
jgi:hypothetical protein